MIGKLQFAQGMASLRQSQATMSWTARTGEWGTGNVHLCEDICGNGDMSLTDWDRDTEEDSWEGMEGCESGDAAGMLLNLDEGTLTVYKNNRCLGVMKDGLSGPYCWSASI
ncbi:hypothetical protein THAOC_34525 [Thalassiosira oceanica]|uniref:B30.2/SPRY domain-containing protein n=1 Tax=Thalassiosira oceanica TaxID=159749 RepID=K0R3D5_THAOC|nr:hypothetical protein THAOC_34525 [Thalassiosira oceanica]|eukprot:EJK46790.1 hypothetical protein THAOC_34525 [Thalassiosira oceanica]